jgi:Flp pilus assembly protein TadG
MYRPLRRARRPAAVLPLTTICLVALLGFVALAIDVGMMAVARSQAQSAADIAALAGARTLNGLPGNNRLNAEAEAVEAARANYVLGAEITDGQVTGVRTGVYKYNSAAARFEVDFDNAPVGTQAYGAMQVSVTTDQGTYFGRVLGVTSLHVGARATAVHRPRDIAVVLDFSGSMKFASEFNWPPVFGSVDAAGGLNPDDRFPRFGPWRVYPLATPGQSNPMQYAGTSYVDSGGEVHGVNNLTVRTANGPPLIQNFQTNAAAAGTNAFVYNGDLSGGSFNINNTPVCTPAPASWSNQYVAGYKGDRWPLRRGVTTTAPTVGEYAKHVADIVYNPVPAVANNTRDAGWEANGYDSPGLTGTNGPFTGYGMGPGYFGKTFYMWPPDPRYQAGADPTTISSSNPAQDASGRWIADWRKRFFLYPGPGPDTKGPPLDDNSRLWDTAGQWKGQGLGSTPIHFVPNYDALLRWIKTGPRTLPPALRAGRVLYYDAIPDALPVDWQSGLIRGSATENDRFWKEYIDFVVGAGRHRWRKTLYGVGPDNTWGGQTFGTPQITPKASLAGVGGNPPPYMHYADCPVHPRLHLWFGPLTMLGFLGVSSNNLDYNWMAGTTYEAQAWQLKAGIRSALEDIKKNHPDDLAALTFFSSHNGYATPRVPMGRDYDRMQACLYYPYSLVGSLGTVASEKRPYKTGMVTIGSPCGLDPANYYADIPAADGGTNPTMGLMVAYNQFNWTGSYTGRKGAAKVVILETDGVANQRVTGSFNPIGGGGSEWTGITNGGSAPTPFNGHPDAMNPAITLAWLINQDASGSKPWPTYPAYTDGAGVASAGAPVKWTGLTANGPGFSTPRSPARVHALGFGEVFEAGNGSPIRTRALEFLRNVQIAGGTSPEGTTAIESYKVITGTADERIDKLRQALERIMQGGIQVALIE